jgi:hypothetical protein
MAKEPFRTRPQDSRSKEPDLTRKRRIHSRPERGPQSTLDRARDELFSAIQQCGVIKADADEQLEWIDETMDFMKERHPELTGQELEQLRGAGLRFCQPVIPHGADHSARATQDANAA